MPKYFLNVTKYYFFPSSLLCDSTALERTLAASDTGGSLILIRLLEGLLWTSDQPVAKAATYTGQHNTEIRGHTSMLYAGFEQRPQTACDADTETDTKSYQGDLMKVAKCSEREAVAITKILQSENLR
jgi:hypothetical protein